MDWIGLLVITICCIIGLLYLKYRIDQEFNPKVKMLASYSINVKYISGSKKGESWDVGCTVFSNGEVHYTGQYSEDYFTGKDKVFAKYLFPLSKGATLVWHAREDAKNKGVIFYE